MATIATCNTIVASLVKAGLIDKVIGMTPANPGDYVFEVEYNKELEAQLTEIGAVVKIDETTLGKLNVKLSKAKKPASIDKIKAEIARLEAKIAVAKGEAVALTPKVEPITDAKFVVSFLKLAYNGLIGAILNEDGYEKPVFDEEEEDEYDGVKPAKPMTAAEGWHNAAVAYRAARHYGRIDGLGWLFNMSKLEKVEKDGKTSVERTKVTLIDNFDTYLNRQIEESAEDSNWHLSCVRVKQLGFAKALEVMNLQDAKEDFHTWLNDVPWNKDGAIITRREKIVARVADRKWEALLKAVDSGKTKDIEKALNDWAIIGYSPKAKQQIAEFKKCEEYSLILDEREATQQRIELEQQAREMRKMEIASQRMTFQMQAMQMQLQQQQLMQQMAGMSASIKAQMDAMKAQAAALVPAAAPAAPAPQQQEEQAPQGVKPNGAWKQGQRPVGLR